MGSLPYTMAVLRWTLLATVTTTFAQAAVKKESYKTNNVDQIRPHEEPLRETQVLQVHGAARAKLQSSDQELVFTGQDGAAAGRHVVKREAKKPKNTMRRRKYSKKKMEAIAQKEKDDPASKPKSKSLSSKSESSSDDDESEVPETKSSSESSSSSSSPSDSLSSYSLCSTSHDDDSYTLSSSSKSSDSDSSKSSDSSSSDTSSSATEEVSLTSEEESEKPFSGPDSSSRDSSDSTDESSASRHIKTSSDISYTISSDASVYSSSEESSDSSESNTKEVHVNATVKLKKGKIAKVKVNFNKKDNNEYINEGNLKRNNAVNTRNVNQRSSLDNKSIGEMVISKSKDGSVTHHLETKGLKMLGMTKHAVKTHLTEKSPDKHKMEMMKVKPAANYSKKKEELEHDLLRDYPEKGSVEVVNWEGTFAPIHGEPYVAPLHHQPDSFWDAIYRSTDPDLPTPPGADVSLPQPTTYPQVTLNAKTKDKGKKEKKKPKLSIKEKKKKKKEKQENPNENNMIRAPGRIKLSKITSHGDVNTQSLAGDLHKIKMTFHAADKSADNLKTPSEEERESGTTYRPEGNYEYPSFRHPDFNPDTAYDENGIPIHESPGWTPPPTLPGDYRFGNKHRHMDAELAARLEGHRPAILLKPQECHPSSLGLVHPQDLHKALAVEQHQHLAANQGVIPMEQHGLHNLDVILPAHHAGTAIEDTGVSHTIYKREASESVSKESLDKVKKSVQDTQQKRPSRDYKAYKLTSTELHNKEDSAPLEALNPALFMHRNMLKAREKKSKHRFHNIPESAEVIAVIVSPQNGGQFMGQMNLGSVRKLQRTKAPIVYKKNNEARNPLLYKNRNMFKVSDLKDDGFRMSKDVINQADLNNPFNKNNNVRAVGLDDYVKQRQALSGKGRENFNPLFINNNKLFSVRTNKFKPTSVESYVVKREVKESQNPHLYSFQNIFSRHPKQILPINVKKIFSKNPKQILPLNENKERIKDIHPLMKQGRLFGGGVPLVDGDSQETHLDPKAKDYLGKNKEAMNPFLVNFPNMFAVSPNIHNGIKMDAAKLKKHCDSKMSYCVTLQKSGFNPFLFSHQRKETGVEPENAKGHPIKKREYHIK